MSQIFLWVRRSGRKYYIAASSEKSATRWLKAIEKKRIKKYRGLAKHALGRIAHKVAASVNVADNVEQAAQTIAERNTNVQKSSTGFNDGQYSITMEDNLDYAMLALKNGEQDVNTCLQRALNATTAIINKRCENLLGFNKIDTPFPKD